MKKCYRECPDRAIGCRENCAIWKKQQFFHYLEKRKRKAYLDAEAVLRENACIRKVEWEKKK